MLACLRQAKPAWNGSRSASIWTWHARSDVFLGTWDFTEVQTQWPCLTKEAQRYIACFETLAQLALMRIAWAAEGQTCHCVCIPTGADNTASEAGVNKLFTAAWPLQLFVQLVGLGSQA